MEIIKIILAIIIGIGICDGINESFKARGIRQLLIIVITVIEILFEIYLIRG